MDLESARAALKETEARVPWKLLRLEVANDLKAFSDRAQEPSIRFPDLIKDMKRRGKL